MAVFVTAVKKAFRSSVDITEDRILYIPFDSDYLNWVKQQGLNNLVTMVQANGDEKEYILAQFDNLPTTKGDMCIWVGDLANFIAANLS